jgi:hypothetical protein
MYISTFPLLGIMGCCLLFVEIRFSDNQYIFSPDCKHFDHSDVKIGKYSSLRVLFGSPGFFEIGCLLDSVKGDLWDKFGRFLDRAGMSSFSMV